ncbi:MAG TPA: anaerobic ribonucleoside-triphosphate reductase, partial [Firmicutes bacterium]|nr:anaerobic ribonucleoside-triphosphate reductase [Bacillota bacterium]
MTASTIASQIIACVASSQYGGSTITLTHLAPFVRDSYNIYLNKYLKRGLDDNTAQKFAKEDTQKEIEDSIQTLNYQINSLMT